MFLVRMSDNQRFSQQNKLNQQSGFIECKCLTANRWGRNCTLRRPVPSAVQCNGMIDGCKESSALEAWFSSRTFACLGMDNLHTGQLSCHFFFWQVTILRLRTWDPNYTLGILKYGFNSSGKGVILPLNKHPGVGFFGPWFFYNHKRFTSIHI